MINKNNLAVSLKYDSRINKSPIVTAKGTGLIADNIIGEYSMIGAGSVITKNVSPFTVWYGNPATHKGYITRNSELLDLELKDKSGIQYKLIDDEPIKI